MNMNDPHSEQFEQLRRLLVLKRYEQPPPQFFNRLPQQVMARIKAGEKAAEPSFFDYFSWESPWLHRLWAAFETRPMLAGSVGLAVCALLIGGLIISDQDTHSGVNVPSVQATPFAEPAFAQTTPAALPVSASGTMSSISGLPTAQPQGSLFEQIEKAQARTPFPTENVVFRPGN